MAAQLVFSVQWREVCRFLQNVKKRPITVDPVALGIGNLLHNSMLYEQLNCALRGGEGQVQLIRSAGDGDEWICGQQA